METAAKALPSLCPLGRVRGAGLPSAASELPHGFGGFGFGGLGFRGSRLKGLGLGG